MRDLRLLLLPLLAITLLAAVPTAVRAQEAAPPATASDCEMCHDQIVPAFKTGPHGRAMEAARPGTVEHSCVTCHGPGQAHMDDPSTENIRRLPTVSACLECHPAAQASMARTLPAHDRADVECLDCHVSGHTAAPDRPLLRSRPAELCGTCHQQEKASFQLPFAHRKGMDPFSCTDCHAVHGGTQQGRLLEGTRAGSCVTCHTGKAGPFVFPHPPLDVDGCVACHQPHGSPNPRLLRRRTVLSLCLECHAGVPAFHDLSQARYRACQTCHAAVHGSNRDPRLIEE
jgi:DmsE family decaheme c-type cytochrome